MQHRQKRTFSILQYIAIVLLISCQTNIDKVTDNTFSDFDTTIMPPFLKAGNPIINALSDFTAPTVEYLSLKQKAKIQSADFYAPMQNYNTEEGLALSSVRCGFKDSSGILWFGTAGNGVSTYDGKTFANFNSSDGLIHNLINDITEDSKGNIWFATYGGVSKYNGSYFENFTTTHGLSNNDINRIFEDSNGNIWISTINGLSLIEAKNNEANSVIFKNFSEKEGLPGKYIGEIIEDQRGNIWVCTDFGICKYNPDEKLESRNVFGIQTGSWGLKDLMVNCIAEDKNGLFWIGTNHGAIMFDPNNGSISNTSITLFTTDNGLVHNFINCIYIDSDENVWIGTEGGVSEFRIKDESFINYTTEQGLTNNNIFNITEDNQGSLWFGTMGGGLCRYDGSAIVTYSAQQGLKGNTIFCFADDKNGNLWVGSDNAGITQIEFDNGGQRIKNFVNYTTKQGLPNNSISTMIFDKSNNLWVGSADGLCKYDGKSFVNYTTQQGLTNDNVVSLEEDLEGNLWIGTYDGGISKFDGNSFTNYTTNQGLINNTIWDILEDKDRNFWFATRGGLSHFDGKSFMNFTIDQGLPDNKLSSVIQDKTGNILIGSWGGGVSILRKSIVEKLKNNTLEIQDIIFENISSNEGLSNDVIYNLVEDSSGNIFIGSNVGITVFKGGLDPSRQEIAKEGIENYNQPTAFPIKDISNNCAMILDKHGIIWAGTGDKMVRFDYNSVKQNNVVPKVFIQRVSINNENISWNSLQRNKMKFTNSTSSFTQIAPHIIEEHKVFGRKLNNEEHFNMFYKFKNIKFDSISRFYAIPKNLILPYSFNSISIDFVGIVTTRSLLVRYQYKLDGFDKKWSKLNNQTTANYGNLPFGNYVFAVKAQSIQGVWSEPVFFPFKINPPWYRTWFAYTFYLIIILIGFFYVDRLQRKRLIIKERQRSMKRELDQAKEIEKAYKELKSTQSQLIQSEKMASLGELTAGIAHEIQNPLNFVNNFSEVSNELIDEMNEELNKGDIEEAKAIASDIKQNLEKINHHGKRADAIVKGMLQHSRSSSGGKEPTDINTLADEYLRLAYHGLRAKDKSFNATMNTNYDESIGKIDIIPQDIGRVILNLITNAFYVVNEKKVLVASDLTGQNDYYNPTVSISTKKEGSKVLISVKDNGNGIPPEIKDKIFQPFFTTKPTGQGTGLGLSLAYDIIKAHGGELNVVSKEGEGSIFNIILTNS